LVIVETSGREKYAPTRAFYESIGYLKEAVLRNFTHRDDLVIYTNRFERNIPAIQIAAVN